MFDTLDIQVFTVDPTTPANDPIGFRISRTMRGEDEFRRIAARNTTTLAKDLQITDTTIYVTDASALPKPGVEQGRPGVIYINGEKITYWQIDRATDSLTQIRRGVHGTGAPLVHIKGSEVVDASLDQKIPGDTANMIWLNTTPDDQYTVTDGLGLRASVTEQALFLKAAPSNVPWLPGEYDWTDPNSGKFKYDGGPYDESKGYDSFTVE